MDNKLKTAIFEVWCWQYSNTDCFNQRLIDLFRKADSKNKFILSQAYPEMAQAIKLWEEADDNGDALFVAYGFKTRGDHGNVEDV